MLAIVNSPGQNTETIDSPTFHPTRILLYMVAIVGHTVLRDWKLQYKYMHSYYIGMPQYRFFMSYFMEQLCHSTLYVMT